jgi:hypothetical protein
MASWLQAVGFVKLSHRTNFLDYLAWKREVETTFRRAGIKPQQVSPLDLLDLSLLFISKNFHRHLEVGKKLGVLRWGALLQHLERKEFKFSYTRLVDEMERVRQGVHEAPLDFS